MAKTLPSPHPTAPAPPAPAAETDEDEDDASSENSDDVLIDDDDEYDYSFPIPSPAPAKPPTPSTKPPTKSDKPDKDEFERPAAAATAAPVPFTPREAEIMAIPADALASVRHGAGSTAEGTTQSQAQVQARETVPLTPPRGGDPRYRARRPRVRAPHAGGTVGGDGSPEVGGPQR